MKFRGPGIRFVSILLGLFAMTSPVAAQYPMISILDQTDPAFEQQQESVRLFYRQMSAGADLPELTVYSYRTTPEDTLFGIAARLSVPYSGIATLNRMERSALGEPGRFLFLPNIPGVFVPLTPGTDLEFVMHDLRHEQTTQVVSITGESAVTFFRFYPGSDFSPEERSSFLGLLFRRPLRVITVSSPFGPRYHPVTGVWGFHAGVDFAAARGTPVVAARSGEVIDTGNDSTMGNYILLQHSGGFTTFYGHLDTVVVSLKDSVTSGMIIGTVGSTGTTTGSHLHFEIRHDTDPRDPMKMLP